MIIQKTPAIQKQKIAVFDIDGTIFRSGLYREVMFELIRSKKIPKELEKIYATEKMNWKIRKSNNAFTIFEDKTVEAFFESIQYIKISDYEIASKKVVEKLGNYCYRYTTDLIKQLKKKNYFIIAISGSQNEVVQHFAALHHIDLAVGSVYKRDSNGYFAKDTPTVTWTEKEKVLQKILDWDKFTLDCSYAVGDTMGDYSLLKYVQNPIVFNPQKELLAVAKKEGWPIIIERKNVIYRLESKNGEYLAKI